MDTKPLENEALDWITSTLSRYNKRFVKMSFDEDGADFYIIKKEESDSSLILKCLKGQSKGRNITNRGEDVVIPKEYVTDNFLVFVYVKKVDTDEAVTYMYSADDIRSTWKDAVDDYKLYLPKDINHKEENKKYLFNKHRSELIDKLLDEVGVDRNESDVINLSDAEFYFKMWQKTGGLPSFEYLCDLFEFENKDDLAHTDKFIFLLCASVVVNYDFYDQTLSIDWAFEYLKESKNRRTSFEDVNKGKSFRSDVAIAFGRTWVQELLSENGLLIGYHLHIADDEESIDARVMKNGEYGVVYNQRI